MKKLIPLLFALLALAGCSPEYEYTQITMEEAIAMMEETTDYILLDVRTHEEFAELHIPGAICVPNETIEKDDIPELPDKEQLILVYCRSGNRSKTAARILSENGYEVLELATGYLGWTDAGKAVE